MKIKRGKIISKKAGMSFTQILILIISLFAFSYLINSAFEIVEASIVDDAEDLMEDEKFRQDLEEFVRGRYYQTEKIILETYERSLAGYACCEETINEGFCQFVPAEQCEEGTLQAPTLCRETSFCEFGCCLSDKTGWCNENTPRIRCEIAGGIWKDDKFCNIQECQRGCCVIGNNAFWSFPGECEAKSRQNSVEMDFRQDVANEIECIFLTEKDDEGACVTGNIEKTCRFTTRESCRTIAGDFYKNIFCSDSGLETECEAHDHKACSDNSQDQSVYWYDSCGNREEIAEECSIFTGTICGLVEGDYKCKSIDCEVDGKTRKNGESWCEYEGKIGEGRDVVGSRHIKHICFMGEERIEPCTDYRNEICVQTDTKLERGVFSEAACRVNNWRSCLEANTLESKEAADKKCSENPDCTTRGVHIDKFSFDMCVPQYPPGFDLETHQESAQSVCKFATQQCTVIYIKDWKGKCKCEVNCGCEKAGFTEQMNELCITLGDCGAYVNVEGEVTDDGYSVSGAPRLSQSYLDSSKRFAINVAGQKVAPGDLSFLGRLGVSPEDVAYEPGEKGLSWGTGLGMAGVGFALQVASYLATYAVDIGVFNALALESAVTNAMSWGGTAGSPALGAFGNALAGAGAMLAIGTIATKLFGIEGEGAKIIMIASIIAAGWTAALALTTTLDTFFFIPYDPLTLVILIIVIIIVKLLGIGEVCKEKTVRYTCMPWQPPTGGDDCDKCNDDSHKPCSKYRCKSLGQTCELINEGTEHQMCVGVSPDDVSSPRIFPLLGTITEGYEYYNIKDIGFEVVEVGGNCIPEYTKVLFGVETNKPSQCKIGTSALQTYDEMEEFFGGNNFYLINHTMMLNIPSPSAFANAYNLTDEQIKDLGEITYYVKCKSVTGNVNVAAYTIKTCVKPGPDLTAPYVTKTSPVNGAYVKYNAEEQLLSLWTNEPASCRWDFNEKSYENMENEMSCETDLEDYGLYGWPCNTTLTNLQENNMFYIKCQDQPWLDVNASERNTMKQSYIYTLTASASELNIDRVYPNKDIIAGFEPVTVTLEAFTSGGAEQGVSECSFKFTNSSYIRFYNTFSNQHQQIFSSMTRGNYRIDVRCEDVAGNIAENFTEFSVKIDTEAPVITRAYYDGSLIIITNEPSECAYSITNSKCNFEINNENATLMTGNEKEHSANWDTESTYYIKCKDRFDREPGKCSIILRPYDVL